MVIQRWSVSIDEQGYLEVSIHRVGRIETVTMTQAEATRFGRALIKLAKIAKESK